MDNQIIVVYAIFASAACLLVGFAAHLLQRKALRTWYPYLTLSRFTPPSHVFAFVWTVLYILMGISAAIVYARSDLPAHQNPLLRLFVVQLALNFLWSVFFFYLRRPMLGFFNLVVLNVVVGAYIVRSIPVSWAASALLWPYMLWLLFATYLNIYVAVKNR